MSDVLSEEVQNETEGLAEQDQKYTEETPHEVTVSEDKAEDEGEVIVTIGDESPPPEEEEHAQAPAWVKELRKSHKEILRENKELKAKLTLQSRPEEEGIVTLGKKPALEDFDFDTDKYEENLAQWYERKRIAEEQEAKVKAKQEAEAKAWQEQVAAYGEAKAKLKVPDYDDAEEVVKESLSPIQQGIILQGAENPALLVYALGKNSAKAKEIAAITDPVKYAFALAKLESQLKVSKRSAPAPERVVSIKSAGALTNSTESTLDRLRAEAEKTGDHSKVLAYRRQLKEKGR